MIEKIKLYIKSIYGYNLNFKNNKNKLNLNINTSLLYNFWYCEIKNQAFEIIELKRNVSVYPTPKQIALHSAKISKQLNGLPVVFVANQIVSYNRKRLIEKNIPFIIPNRQLYLPFLNIAINDVRKNLVKEYYKLSVPAQMLLIHYLNKGHNGINIDEASKIIDYSRVSVIKAFDELEYFNFAFRDKKKHKLIFRENKKELFEEARYVMFNPCRKMVYVDGIPEGVDIYESGINALSKISMISPAEYEEVCVLSADYNKCCKEEFVPKASAHYHLELWHYNPSFVFKNKIDPLSLILSLSKNIDERVQGEIENILENFKW